MTEKEMDRGHHQLDRSTNQHGSQGHGRQAQMASRYAHQQPSWRTALDAHPDTLVLKASQSIDLLTISSPGGFAIPLYRWSP